MDDTTDSTEYSGPEIPTPLGERLERGLGLDDRPETFGDWVEAMLTIAERGDLDVDLDALCTTEESPHRATYGGESQHYQCVLDPIIVPFLADGGRIDVETECPASGRPIEFTVTETSMTVDPATAVLSFGIDADVDAPDGIASPALVYGRICPSVNAFATREEYETWAADVDAVTMALSADDALALARALGRAA